MVYIFYQLMHSQLQKIRQYSGTTNIIVGVSKLTKISKYCQTLHALHYIRLPHL